MRWHLSLNCHRAAQLLIAKRDACRQRGAQLKKRRLGAKRVVRDAADNLAAWEALKAVSWS
ncbi:MAG: hypothetical protein KIT00_04300 [Rhodospirillales bacterium]|nr:hypothetical protein [Rhodospirillales bacterium]